jgi:cytochrome c peroxidase
MSRGRIEVLMRIGRKAVALLAVGSVLLSSAPVWAVNLAAPPSLKLIPVPEPNNLGNFLKSDPNPDALNPSGFPIPTLAARKAAIALGKALFWDLQVGSDGVTACASCHFHAGADNRAINQVSPGLKGGDTTFQLIAPNGTLTSGMFPLHTYANPDDRFSPVLRDTNDVVSSQGVHLTDFERIRLRKNGVDATVVVADPTFNLGGVNTRRVEPRNAPTVINAAFNFANFWDGRANNIFNGVNPFGDADPDAGVYVIVRMPSSGTTTTTTTTTTTSTTTAIVAGTSTATLSGSTTTTTGKLQKVPVRIPMSSLASQAVGPPGSDFEMSATGRTFSDIGHKFTAVVGKKSGGLLPLAKQLVHPDDSVLGQYSRWRVYPTGTESVRRGLTVTYPQLIKTAFQDKYWASTELVTIGDETFSQMEANFSLFFGLAVQMYEATLISNDSPFDRFQEGDATAMSRSAQSGLSIFLGEIEQGTAGASCINCHGGPEFTNASVSHVGATNFGASLPEALMELMTMGSGNSAFYDAGFYDIGVRPIEEDPGRGGTDPFGNPLSFTDRALLIEGGALLNFANPPLACGCPGSNPPACPAVKRSATLGSFKAPSLRNVELTGPYFHNGGQATLRQVVDFYTRGGDFHERNIATLDPDISLIFGLVGNLNAKNAVVDFLLSLTDERVRWERAPFDHPELPVPNGSITAAKGTLKLCGGDSCDIMLKIPAVGANGLAAEGLPPIGPFLGLDPKQP